MKKNDKRDAIIIVKIILNVLSSSIFNILLVMCGIYTIVYPIGAITHRMPNANSVLLILLWGISVTYTAFSLMWYTKHNRPWMLFKPMNDYTFFPKNE